MSKYLLLLLAAGTLSAQTVSFGVKAGAPLTDPGGSGGVSIIGAGISQSSGLISASGSSRTSVPYAFGPSVEVRLSRSYSIEGSAILHHFRSSSVVTFESDTHDSQTVFNRLRGNAWEFPVLAKRYFRARANRWAPYAGAGAAIRTVGYRYDGVTQAISGGISTSTPFASQSRSGLGAGAAFEAGIRSRVGRIALLPEVRYTHWADRRAGLNKEDVGVNLGFRF